jgi:CheY-like chemotaxis protein
MYKVLLIDDNDANQLIAENNLNTIEEDAKVICSSSYEEALQKISKDGIPSAIIANNHIWSSNSNIITFLDELKKDGSTAYIPMFISALSIKQNMQIKLLNYANMICVLDLPVSLVDAAIVVNHLHRKNHVDTLLFANSE